MLSAQSENPQLRTTKNEENNFLDEYLLKRRFFDFCLSYYLTFVTLSLCPSRHYEMARHVKVDLSLCPRQAQILFAFIIREGKGVNKNSFNIWKKVFFSAISMQ